MGVIDLVVRQRDALLDRLLRIRHNEVLNPPALGGDDRTGIELIGELKRAANTLKAEAYDPTSGLLDYAGLRQSETYARYRSEHSPQLRTLDPATLATREQQLAFWINLYNTLVVDAVIAFGIKRSVREWPAGLLSFFRRAAYNVGGYRFSCEDIEHGILRANRGLPLLPGPQFAPSDPRRCVTVSELDPRIHFALNCGARSCPPISVYDPQHIDTQLDLATRSFIGADITIDRARHILRLSPIFRWYARDFGGRSGIISFLLRYLPDDELRSWLEAHQCSVRLRYQPYDWALNAPLQ